MRTIKQLLEVMLEHQELFITGLCHWNSLLYNNDIITFSEKQNLSGYIQGNKPSKYSSCESVEVNLLPYDGTKSISKYWGGEYKIIIPKEEPKQELPKTQIDWSGFPKSTQKQVGFTEPNIIDDWLDKNGNPEISKQVEEEAEELCKQEKNNLIESFLIKNSFKKKQNNVFYNSKCTIKVLENCYQIDFKNPQYGEVTTYTECLSIPYLVGTLTWHELISRNYKK